VLSYIELCKEVISAIEHPVDQKIARNARAHPDAANGLYAQQVALLGLHARHKKDRGWFKTLHLINHPKSMAAAALQRDRDASVRQMDRIAWVRRGKKCILRMWALLTMLKLHQDPEDYDHRGYRFPNAGPPRFAPPLVPAARESRPVSAFPPTPRLPFPNC
jgi:hypothetical protein